MASLEDVYGARLPAALDRLRRVIAVVVDSQNMGIHMSVKKYLVVSPHKSEFPRPITFKKGVPLVIGEEYEGSEGWDNWFFCSTPGQEPGWVPGQVIERVDGSDGRALDDYTARELDVQEGEVLTGTRTLNGWRWCEKPGGSASGWVPLENLKEILD